MSFETQYQRKAKRPSQQPIVRKKKLASNGADYRTTQATLDNLVNNLGIVKVNKSNIRNSIGRASHSPKDFVENWLDSPSSSVDTATDYRRLEYYNLIDECIEQVTELSTAVKYVTSNILGNTSTSANNTSFNISTNDENVTKLLNEMITASNFKSFESSYISDLITYGSIFLQLYIPLPIIIKGSFKLTDLRIKYFHPSKVSIDSINSVVSTEDSLAGCGVIAVNPEIPISLLLDDQALTNRGFQRSKSAEKQLVDFLNQKLTYNKSMTQISTQYDKSIDNASFKYSLRSYDITHIYLASSKTHPYGDSYLASSLNLADQLATLTALLAVGRHSRIEKTIVSIKTNTDDPVEASNQIQDIKASLDAVNEEGYNQKKAPTVTEKIFVPKDLVEFEQVGSSVDISNIDDVEFNKKRLIETLVLPKGIFHDDDGNGWFQKGLDQQSRFFFNMIKPYKAMYHQGIYQLLSKALVISGYDPKKLELEITSSVIGNLSESELEIYENSFDNISTMVGEIMDAEESDRDALERKYKDLDKEPPAEEVMTKKQRMLELALISGIPQTFIDILEGKVKTPKKVLKAVSEKGGLIKNNKKVLISEAKKTIILQSGIIESRVDG